MLDTSPTSTDYPQLPALAHDQPDVYELLLNAWATDQQSLGPDTFNAVVARVRSILWKGTPDPSTNAALSRAQQTVLDNFVQYVPNVTSSMISDLESELGKAGARNFVDAVYITDQACRLEITHGVLFPDHLGSANVPEDAWERSPISPSRASVAYHDAIAAKQEILHPTDRELVRLLAGRYHQCVYCMSIRISSDGVPHVSKEMEPALLNFEASDLSEAQKAALAYAEAHMQEPTRVDARLRERLKESFSDSEILQLTLEVSCWNYQKLLVALSTHKPAHEEFVTLVTIDEHGVIHHGEVLDYSFG